MVDWSAAASPRLGRDSIWLCALRRENGRLRQIALENIATRLAARDRLAALLAEDLAAGRRMLAGFDFPMGYPEGFAAKLGLGEPAWRASWNLLATEIVDGPANANQRFAVAARLNQRISEGPAPFWGCPKGKVGRCLAMTHHR